MNILHFYPSNKRSISLETYLLQLKALGHNVSVLTTCQKGSFHSYLESKGIKCFTTNVASKTKLLYYLKNVIFLIKFCKKHKIHFVFSHLQHANIIAVYAQQWIKAKTIIFRHHLNNPAFDTSNKMEIIFDKIIHRKAKKIIVASQRVKEMIVEQEKVNSNKIGVIPYIYDFSLYKKPNEEIVHEITHQNKAELLLLMCSRFVANKRHSLIFELMNKWVHDDRLDIKLMLLDSGPLFEDSKLLVKNMKLEEHITFVGFTENFVEYMKAADILIHPSLSETSSSTVKEMGLLSKTVAVCKNVGDFEDYIQPNQNGFLISDQNSFAELDHLVSRLYQDKQCLQSMGKKLNQTVIEKFGLDSGIMSLYVKLINS